VQKDEWWPAGRPFGVIDPDLPCGEDHVGLSEIFQAQADLTSR
jgi:hypothetical protein